MKLPSNDNALLHRNVLLVLSIMSAFGAALTAYVNIARYDDARLPVILLELFFTLVFLFFAVIAVMNRQKNWHNIGVVYSYTLLILYIYCAFPAGNSVIQWWYTVPLIAFLLLARVHSVFFCSAVLLIGSTLFIFSNVDGLGRNWNAGLVNLVFPYLIISAVAYTYQRMRLVTEQNLVRLTVTDPLTGALNRKGLSAAYDKHVRVNTTFSLVLLDIDKFKSINDNYGHNAGDRVLVEFTRILAEYCDRDQLFRLGGEEFVMLLTMPVGEAFVVMEQLREEIASTPFRFETRTLHTSFSAGLCEFKPNSTLTSLLQCADKLLYQAKSTGRNKVLA